LTSPSSFCIWVFPGSSRRRVRSILKKRILAFETTAQEYTPVGNLGLTAGFGAPKILKNALPQRCLYYHGQVVPVLADGDFVRQLNNSKISPSFMWP